MASGEQIQSALRAFVKKWADYSGSEKAEAQTFLNELFACYGSDRQAVGAKFEDFRTSAGFMDMHWPGICIVEMKAPNRNLTVAQQQVERYWRESSDRENEIGAAKWVLLCSFQRFEIWEPGRYPNKALVTFTLEDLPDKYDALAFLAGPNVEPNFAEHHRELTRDAAKIVSEVYHSLKDRSAAPADELPRFILQSVWCMFAEDLGMLETFAWPDPVTDAQRDRVAEASRRLLARRTEICKEEQIGLTKLYNAVDEGAWADLKALHRVLDEAVVDCYRWPKSVAQDDRELVRRLTERNREIVEGNRPYAPFGE